MGKNNYKKKRKRTKKRFRNINFNRTSQSSGIVIGLEHDPIRNANIAAVFEFINNKFFYMLAPKNLSTGQIVESGLKAKLNLGNSLPLFKIPEGSFIHNICTQPGIKAKLTRAAGTSSIIKEKTMDY